MDFWTFPKAFFVGIHDEDDDDDSDYYNAWYGVTPYY